MKKRIIAAMMSVMVIGSCFGCGKKEEVPSDQDVSEDFPDGNSYEHTDTESPEDSSAEPTDSGSSPDDSSLADTLLADEASAQRNEYVIYCPDDTLPDIFALCYPGYEIISEPTHNKDEDYQAEGKIGDMQIHWVIGDYLSDDENAGHLDELLIRQRDEGASGYDWIDLCVVDEVNIEKYIGDEVDVAIDLRKIGISKSQMKQQFPYTRELVSDGRKLLGASIDVSPGVFMYRRSIARDVLGTDDPEIVGTALRDWEAFRETAEKTGRAGYKMLAGYDSAFDAYAQSDGHNWQTDDGSISVPESLLSWVETTYDFSRQDIIGQEETGTDAWMDGITGKGNVFGYFLSAEEIELLKTDIDESNTDSYGDWSIVPGPAAWYRGGTWLCAAAGTPNPAFSAEIIKNLTCDDSIMKDIYEKTGLTVNNKRVLSGAVTDKTAQRDLSDAGTAEVEAAEASAADALCDPFFAGQQTGPVYAAAAERIADPVADWERWILDDMFEEAYYPYFRGECSMNDSLTLFYQKAKSLIITEDEEW